MSTESQDPRDQVRRRSFLKTTGLAVLGAPAIVTSLGANTALAKENRQGSVSMIDGAKTTPMQGAVAQLEPQMSRRLHLFNEHTGDDVDVVYYTHGLYIYENLARLNHLMRDRRANAATQMDTTLFNQLFLLREELGTNEAVHVLSGYRTPETNAKLRRRSKGVAKYSLHMEGRAADIYVPGFSVQKIHKVASEFKAGGVGVYTRSNFVHVDTGQVRHWGS